MNNGNCPPFAVCALVFKAASSVESLRQAVLDHRKKISIKTFVHAAEGWDVTPRRRIILCYR
jgi:hypothetical protein